MHDGIYERDDSPYWWASFIRPDGRAARRSTRIRVALDPHGVEARRVRASFMIATEPVAEPSEAMTWDELVAAYLPALERRVRPRTLLRYESALRGMYPYWTGKPAATTTGEVKAYLRKLAADGYKPATINVVVGMMQGLYSWANDELELDIGNPWARRTTPPHNERRRYLSREEVDRLITAALVSPRTAHMADFIRLAVHTGMRQGEILALSWDRVDLDAGVISFAPETQKSGQHSTIPINAGARVALLARQAMAQQSGRVTRWVFCGPHGSRLGTVSRAWGTVTHRAGLPDVHQHDLRRTFGSWLVNEGVPIHTVSALLRHASVTITAKVYAHLSNATLREAAAVLDQPPQLRVISRSA